MGRGGLTQQERESVLIARFNEAESFAPASYEVTFPVGSEQGDLFESLDGKRIGRLPASHVIVGTFYERLRIALFGGTHHDNRIVLNGHRQKELIIPDIVDDKGPVESKARNVKKEYLLTDKQVAKYWLDKQSNPDSSFRFAFFDHPVKKIKHYYGGRGELLDELVSGTSAGYVIPLRLAIAAHSFPFIQEDNGLVSRYETRDKRSTRLHRLLFHRMMENPAALIEELQLDPEEFGINFLKSPQDLHYQGKSVGQFPIVEITDRLPYERWSADYKPDTILLTPLGLRTHYLEMAKNHAERELFRDEADEREAIATVESENLVSVGVNDDIPF